MVRRQAISPIKFSQRSKTEKGRRLVVVDIEGSEYVHVHEIVLSLRALVLDDIVRKGHYSVIGLKVSVLTDKDTYESCAQRTDILFQIVEADHGPVRIGILGQIVRKQVHTRVEHHYVTYSRMSLEEGIELTLCILGCLGVDEKIVYPA